MKVRRLSEVSVQVYIAAWAQDPVQAAMANVTDMAVATPTLKQKLVYCTCITCTFQMHIPANKK